MMHLSSRFRKLRITLLSHRTFERYADFWKHFTFAPTIVVAADIWIDEFAYAYSDDEEEDHEDAIAAFAPLFVICPPALELAVADEAITVRYTSLLPLDEWIVNVRGDMKYRSEWRDDPVHGSRHLFAHTNSMPYAEDWPLQDLHTLILSSEAMGQVKDTTAWLARFAHARAVRRIAVPFLDSLWLLYALSEVRNDAADGISLALFPHLEEIVLVEDADRAKIATLHAPLDVSLLDLLNVRKERGAPILRLMVDSAMWTWDVWGRIVTSGTPVRYVN